MFKCMICNHSSTEEEWKRVTIEGLNRKDRRKYMSVAKAVWNRRNRVYRCPVCRSSVHQAKIKIDYNVNREENINES